MEAPSVDADRDDAAMRLVGHIRHRGAATHDRFVERTLTQADIPALQELAIDDVSHARGDDYIDPPTEAAGRRVLAVSCAHRAQTVATLPAKQGRTIVSIGQPGSSENWPVARTWDRRDRTRIMKQSFTWKRGSASARFSR